MKDELPGMLLTLIMFTVYFDNIADSYVSTVDESGQIDLSFPVSTAE